MSKPSTNTNQISSAFPRAPEPATPLGVYRVLSPSCGMRVSPLCLGGMSFGQAWSAFMGDMSKEATFAMLDAYYEAGGNFIDTSNNYQDEESEEWIGEWITKKGIRDQLCLATKFTSGFKRPGDGSKIAVNFQGNSIKSMRLSVEASLKKLQTSYIDLLWMHWYDYTTSIPEVMQGLNDLVRSGKVFYIGVSDTPAWWVSAANQYAADHGMAQFVAYQGRWNVMQRDLEREVIPLCRHWGMAITPWNAIGGGKFQSKKALEERKARGETLRVMRGPQQTDQESKVSEALEKVAHELGSDSVTAVALAYLLAKTPYVFPIVGGRRVEHLKDNIKALELKLTAEQIEYLESTTSFDIGFPTNFIGVDPHSNGSKTNPLMAMSGHHHFVQGSKAIGQA